MAKSHDLTFEDLENGLQIDRNALDEGIIQQPDFFYRVAKMLAMAISQRDEAKTQVAEAEAEADQRIRSHIREDEKVTEGDVKAQIRTDKKVKAAITKHLDLVREVNELDALKEAYKQRSYAFNQLNDLQMMGYFGGEVSSSSGGKVKTVIAERAKRAMSDERRKRN